LFESEGAKIIKPTVIATEKIDEGAKSG